MKLSHISAIVLRQLYLLRGSPTRVIPLFLWVAVDIILWGFITHYLNDISNTSFNFVPIMLGAILLWDFLTRVMQGVTMAFFEDVWSRNFLNIFATPLTIKEYLTGLIITSILTSAVGLIAMLLLATSMFGLSFLSLGIWLVPLLSIIFLFGIALGIAGCALVLKFGPAAEWFVWPIPAILSPFACVFYPFSVLPESMQYIAKLLPPVYVFESLRALLAHQTISFSNVAFGIGLALLYIVLCGWIFIRVYQHAIRSGLIARYSAESVS